MITRRELLTATGVAPRTATLRRRERLPTAPLRGAERKLEDGHLVQPAATALRPEAADIDGAVVGRRLGDQPLST